MLNKLYFSNNAYIYLVVELNINNKKIKFVSYSKKSHLKTNELITLENLEIDTSSKLTKWFFNDEYKSGIHYLQAICPNCKKGLFSVSTTRLIREIKEKNNEISFICRSCSCRENAKKVDIEKRTKIRKQNWNKKSEKEKQEFRQAISEGKLKYAKVTEEKIKQATKVYTIDKEPLETIKEILGVSGKNTAKRILEKNGVEIRKFSEARSVYFQKNPELNPAKRPEVREKISKWLKENPSSRGKNSKIEQIFYDKLIGKKQKHVYINNKQFDVFLEDSYIEFDGVYWHGKLGDSYDLNQIINLLNDEEKNQLIINNKKNLYRVWSDTEFETYTLDEIKEKSYYSIENGIIIKDERKFKEVIITYDYVQKIQKKYPSDFDKNIDLLTSFVQTFYSFPYIISSETLKDVVQKIRNQSSKKLSSNVRVGNDFLKSKFKSFYHSARGTNQSMYDAYNEFYTLQKIIKNRLGITYKEHWDLSPDVIRRGFISNYFGVSFFSPVNAYKIYNKIAQPSDTVLDMSAGFGGRLLGWHAFQNKGTYIGYEPNTMTYYELLKFSKELQSNIIIYNKPFEDVNLEKIDVCFSCPPYFDIETYSTEKTQSIYRYQSWDEWVKKFLFVSIHKMKSVCDRVYLVVNRRIYDEIEGELIDTIVNKGSHFSNKKDNYEYLIKV